MNLHDFDIQYAARNEGIEIGMKRGLQTGIKQGSQSAKIESAKNMLQKGKVTLNDIAEYTGLSLMQIQELQKNILKN